VSRKRTVTPNDQLLGPLLDLLARRLRAEAVAELTTFGLRPRHVIAMTLLRDLGEQSQSDLADRLGIDPTNLVALLNDLEGDALIERRRSPQDRRRHTVVLTNAGARKLADVEHVVAGSEKRLFSALDTEEMATLHTLLHRAAAATADGEEAPAVSPDCTGAALTVDCADDQPPGNSL
jgi:MarR family transcriptional regulator, transcriptional regulator for hemolysin